MIGGLTQLHSWALVSFHREWNPDVPFEAVAWGPHSVSPGVPNFSVLLWVPGDSSVCVSERPTSSEM